MSSERTEAPTPKKKQDARKKGEVSRSQDVVSMGVLLAAVIGLKIIGPALWQGMESMVHDGLANPTNQPLTAESALGMGRGWAERTLLLMAPLLAIIVIAGILLNIAQTGLLVSTAHLTPKMKNINPATGAKKIFSKEGAVNLFKSIAKMLIVGVVVWITMQSRLSELTALGEKDVTTSTAELAGIAIDMALRAAVVLFLLALLDYGWQRRQFMNNLRMTKQEVRQEMRETDGDPQIKGAIRRKRQELMNRMIAAVPKADVVVTNPTHFAVALKYDPVTMGAPVVVAKGADLLAKRIREVAMKAGVPVLEEPPLARALYAAVPVGHNIPANLFHAVAEVLAWVYALKTKSPSMRANAAWAQRAPSGPTPAAPAQRAPVGG
ncbi:MAG: flagellar biosynthesis protein FlhB [Tepidiformaceae bacterium]